MLAFIAADVLPGLVAEVERYDAAVETPRWRSEFNQQWRVCATTPSSFDYKAKYAPDERWCCSCPSYYEGRFRMCKHLVKMVVDLDSGVKISEVTVSPRFSPPFIAIDGLHNSEFLAADDATIALPLVRSLSTYVQPFISSFTIPLRAYQVNVHFSLYISIHQASKLLAKLIHNPYLP